MSGHVEGDSCKKSGATQSQKNRYPPSKKQVDRDHRTERIYGSFSRSLQLPCRILLDDVKATYKKGILKIVMPKCAPERAKRVKIKLK